MNIFYQSSHTLVKVVPERKRCTSKHSHNAATATRGGLAQALQQHLQCVSTAAFHSLSLASLSYINISICLSVCLHADLILGPELQTAGPRRWDRPVPGVPLARTPPRIADCQQQCCIVESEAAYINERGSERGERVRHESVG